MAKECPKRGGQAPSTLHPLPPWFTARSYATNLTSLGFSFPISKMELVIPALPWFIEMSTESLLLKIDQYKYIHTHVYTEATTVLNILGTI